MEQKHSIKGLKANKIKSQYAKNDGSECNLVSCPQVFAEKETVRSLEGVLAKQREKVKQL